MITSDDWLTFISLFFGVNKTWAQHVSSNWNHITGQSGCGCYFQWNEGIYYCNGFTEILHARQVYATGGQKIIGVENGSEDISPEAG